MAQVIQNIQVKIKNSSNSFFLFLLRMTTGSIMGLVFALIADEIIGFSNLSFTFIIVVIAGIFLRISRSWGLVSVFVFNLVAVLVSMLLKMYIIIAPGA